MACSTAPLKASSPVWLSKSAMSTDTGACCVTGGVRASQYVPAMIASQRDRPSEHELLRQASGLRLELPFVVQTIEVSEQIRRGLVSIRRIDQHAPIDDAIDGLGDGRIDRSQRRRRLVHPLLQLAERGRALFCRPGPSNMSRRMSPNA